MSEKTLIVFVRRPEWGKVKTRLAKTMGEEAALDIYRQLIEKTRQLLVGFDGKVAIYYSEQAGEAIAWGREVVEYVQQGDDLGKRMFGAIRDQLEVSEKVVLIGSDCPGIMPEIIHQAFEALDRSDVVLGPTEDGGYYLVGMKKAHAELFEGVGWSTEKVFNQTLEKIAKSNLTCKILPVLRDVDLEDDYIFYVKKGVLNPVNGADAKQ